MAAIARWHSQDSSKQGGFLYAWLLLVLVFEYTRPGVWWAPLQAIPLNAMIPLALFVVQFFVKGVRPWGEIFRDPQTKWLLVFIIAIPLSILWADNRQRSVNTFNNALGYFFLFLMIVRIVTTEKRVLGMFVTLILCHLYLVMMNPQIITDASIRHYVKGAPFMGDGNDYSLSICLLVPAAIHMALISKSKFKQGLWWLAFMLLILAIVGTQSRGASLGIIAVFGYMWLRSSRKALSMVAIGFVALIALMFAPSVYFDRMSTITAYQDESSAQSRIEAWKAATRMALKNPVGVGAGNFPNNFPIYRGPNAPVRWMTAHSMYFLMLGEFGFPGLVLLLVLMLGNIRLHARMRRALELKGETPESTHQIRTLFMLSACFIGFIVSAAFLSVLYYPHIFVLIGIAVAYRGVVINQSGISLAPEKKMARGRKPAAPAAAAQRSAWSTQVSRGSALT